MRSELTESQVAGELGIDRLELYLASAAFRLGRYDSITHLLYFSEEEADEIAAQLGLTRKKLSD